MLEMNERNIQKSLWRCFKHHRFHLFNSYFFDEESDFLCLTGAGYLIEGEIKLTYNDFKADFKKKRHELYKKYDFDKVIIEGPRGRAQHHRELTELIPNYFFYACPEGVIPENEIPNHAGLIYLNPRKYGRFFLCSRIKNPKLLHKNKFDNYKKLAVKTYWKYLTEFLNHK